MSLIIIEVLELLLLYQRKKTGSQLFLLTMNAVNLRKSISTGQGIRKADRFEKTVKLVFGERFSLENN